MKDKLLSCPFCGGEGNVGYYPYVAGMEEEPWAAFCAEEGCYAAIWAATEAEAIEAWNTRHERTCRAEMDWDAMEDEISGYRIWRCSCGELFLYFRGRKPSYCPECGAKVVE